VDIINPKSSESSWIPHTGEHPHLPLIPIPHTGEGLEIFIQSGLDTPLDFSWPANTACSSVSSLVIFQGFWYAQENASASDLSQFLLVTVNLRVFACNSPVVPFSRTWSPHQSPPLPTSIVLALTMRVKLVSLSLSGSAISLDQFVKMFHLLPHPPN
jgi:hypothetical protein